MTNVAGQISFYSAIGAIDRANDLLEIVDVSANGTFNVTPNNLMGITSGSVVSTTMSQTIQNKTLDNTNALTVKAANLTIQDGSDTTKQAVFAASGITTGSTRTLTIPDASGTLVLVAATQTLTNKTLTAPTISGGTIDNATVTVDAISGHTSANTGTVYGVAISSGAISSSAAFGNGVILPSALMTGTGSSWAFQTWVPTIAGFSANPTSGLYYYIQIGKLVYVVINQPNDGTSNATTFTITLPVTPRTITNAQWQGYGQGKDNSTGVTTPVLLLISSGNSTMSIYKDWTGAGWTASGSKRLITGIIWYEAA